MNLSPDKTPMVSIIVLNYNGEDILPHCLNSLMGQDYPQLEIIVVDNGSNDKSEQVVNRFKNITFLELENNLGFSGGNNSGAKIAKGEYILFLNNDVRLPPTCISILVRCHLSFPNAFAMDMKQYDWEGATLVRRGQKLERVWFPLLGNFVPGYNIVPQGEDVIREVPFASGAHLFCKAELFKKLGGFDDTFFLDYEDTDLCWRAWLLGHPIVYVPEPFCFHRVGATFKRRERESSSISSVRYYSRSVNFLRWILKTMPPRICILSIFQMVAKSVALVLLKMNLQKSFLCLKSIWDTANMSKDIMMERRNILGEASMDSSEILYKLQQ
jgi:GT2 family glycosyltransferase